ncbi:hypothetical protein AVEN_249662-1 [Araneus ventricosus]|uniref:Uncharacterized protein n=1 Tax=Araneus ventricosus TaxID=182803 RepID=A0A4Y2PCW4_ARAVE|nr:hypothetical protein AVEN_249662-1 [Araneus ventricosus]
MCVEYCQLNKLLEMGKCIDKNVDYPHEFQLCTKNVRTLTSDIVKNCTLKCRDACYDHFYDVRYEKIGNMDHTSVEMFSYIGGYMGMWLGLSLVSLFDLFETICYLLFYPVGRMKMKTSKNSVKPAPVLQKNYTLGTIY